MQNSHQQSCNGCHTIIQAFHARAHYNAAFLLITFRHGDLTGSPRQQLYLLSQFWPILLHSYPITSLCHPTVACHQTASWEASCDRLMVQAQLCECIFLQSSCSSLCGHILPKKNQDFLGFQFQEANLKEIF